MVYSVGIILRLQAERGVPEVSRSVLAGDGGVVAPGQEVGRVELHARLIRVHVQPPTRGRMQHLADVAHLPAIASGLRQAEIVVVTAARHRVDRVAERGRPPKIHRAVVDRPDLAGGDALRVRDRPTIRVQRYHVFVQLRGVRGLDGINPR